MQNIYYLDNNFVKENSTQYILSIRYATDGLSFSVHNTSERLMAFSYQPYSLDNRDAVIARVKKAIVENELLSLKYKKVYIMPCNKEKTLIPAHIFNKNNLSDLFRVCFPTEKNDSLLYRKIKAMESYIVEILPRSFLTFLATRYQSLCIVNSAYPFIINSLSNTLLNSNHLFIDIHDKYFDILITTDNHVSLFNSFAYSSITDLIYYSLNCIKNSGINKENLQTTISGNLVNDPKLYQALSNHIPNISLLSDQKLNQVIKNTELNSSVFVHQLSLYKCE